MKTRLGFAVGLMVALAAAVAALSVAQEDGPRQQPAIRMTQKGEVQVGTNRVSVAPSDVPRYLRDLGTPTNALIVISCPPISDAKTLEAVQKAIREAGWSKVVTIVY